MKSLSGRLGKLEQALAERPNGRVRVFYRDELTAADVERHERAGDTLILIEYVNGGRGPDIGPMHPAPPPVDVC